MKIIFDKLTVFLYRIFFQDVLNNFSFGRISEILSFQTGTTKLTFGFAANGAILKFVMDTLSIIQFLNHNLHKSPSHFSSYFEKTFLIGHLVVLRNCSSLWLNFLYFENIWYQNFHLHQNLHLDNVRLQNFLEDNFLQSNAELLKLINYS